PDGTTGTIDVGAASRPVAWQLDGWGALVASSHRASENIVVSALSFASGLAQALPNHTIPFDQWTMPLSWTEDGVLLRNTVTGALEQVQLTPLAEFTPPLPRFVAFQGETTRNIAVPISLYHPETWEAIDDTGSDKLSYVFFLRDEPGDEEAITTFAGIEVHPREDDDYSAEEWIYEWLDDANLDEDLTPVTAPRIDVTESYTAATQSFDAILFDRPLSMTVTAVVYEDVRVAAVYGSTPRGLSLYPGLAQAVIASLSIGRPAPFAGELPAAIAAQTPAPVTVDAWKTFVDADAGFSVRYPLAWIFDISRTDDEGTLVQLASQEVPSSREPDLLAGIAVLTGGVLPEAPPTDDPAELLPAVMAQVGLPEGEPLTPLRVENGRVERQYAIPLSPDVILNVTVVVEPAGERFGLFLGAVYQPDVAERQALVDEILASFQLIESEE
ncbi:MAG: hypothetical protein KDD84_14775, partial [Caldilineaceae bacterium]|nr:hypothetical protein [Caldilineaceae bacterium]